MKRDLSDQERKAIELALGRILRMASRPAQPGDEREWYRCRDLIMRLLDSDDMPYNWYPPERPCWVRDRNKGAAGD